MEIDIMAFYHEAVGRLPIADMPELEDCILSGGYCIGLLDPVSNIIFNALNLLCRRRCSSESALPRRGGKREGKRPSAARSSSIITIAFLSYAGLVAFMRTYFRYLSTGQALRYLRLAGADLAVARSSTRRAPAVRPEGPPLPRPLLRQDQVRPQGCRSQCRAPRARRPGTARRASQVTCPLQGSEASRRCSVERAAPQRR